MRVRVSVRAAGQTAKVMTLDELAGAAQQLVASSGMDGHGEVSVLVEGLDERSCVSWRAYCRDADALAALVRRLQAEREALG